MRDSLSMFLLLSLTFAIPAIAQHTTQQTNSTNSQPAFSGWVSGSNDRGTFDLLLGSLSTLFLCAWTAYHPNIHPSQGHVKSFLVRFWWMLLVVLVPEIVLYFAWVQLWTAKKLRDQVNSIQKSRPWLKSRPDSGALSGDHHSDSASEGSQISKGEMGSSDIQPTEWTLGHGFFAVSGGLAVDTSS